MGNIFVSLLKFPIPLLICERIIHFSKDINLRLVDHNFNQLVLSKSEYDNDNLSLLLSLLSIATNIESFDKELLSFDVIKDSVYLKLYPRGWALKLCNKIIKLPDILFVNETKFYFHYRKPNKKFAPLMITKGRIFDIKMQLFWNQTYDETFESFRFESLLNHTIYNYLVQHNKFIIFSYNNQRNPIYKIEIDADCKKIHFSSDFKVNYHSGRWENFLDCNILVMGKTESILIFSLSSKELHQIYLDCWFIDFFDVIGTNNNHVTYVVKYRDRYFKSVDQRCWNIHHYNVITKSNETYEVIGREFKNYHLTPQGIDYSDETNSSKFIKFSDFKRQWRKEPTLVKSLL
jgi:hypothetical protein